MDSERHQEDMTRALCKKFAEKIEKHKKNTEAVTILKELGRQLLDELPNIPVWSYEYTRLFRE